MGTGLLKPNFLKSRMTMTVQKIRPSQRLARAGLETKTRLSAADELNQQLRHILGQVNFTLPILGGGCLGRN